MKIDKIVAEIDRKKAKITELQADIRDLEQKKTEQENLEIVGLVRGVDLPLEELAAMLQAFRNQGGRTPDFMKRKEAPTDEE